MEYKAPENVSSPGANSNSRHHHPKKKEPSQEKESKSTSSQSSSTASKPVSPSTVTIQPVTQGKQRQQHTEIDLDDRTPPSVGSFGELAILEFRFLDSMYICPTKDGPSGLSLLFLIPC
jgi:hypothetical protein